MKHLFFAILLVFQAGLVLAADKAAPQVQVQLTGRESDDTVQKLLKAAQKASPNVVVKITEEQAADDKEAAAASPNLLFMVFRGINVGLQGMAAMLHIPVSVADHFEAHRAELSFQNFMLAFLLVGIAALIGLSVDNITTRFLPDKTIGRTIPMLLGSRLIASLRRVLPDLLGVLVFYKAAEVLGKIYLEPAAPAIAALYSTLIQRAMVVLFYVAGARFMFKPFANGERLIPLPNAIRYKWLLIIYGIIGPAVLMVDDALKWAGATVPERSGWFMFAGSLVAAYKIWFFWYARHDLASLILSGTPAGQEPAPLRRTMAKIAGPLFSCMALLIWMLGRVAAVAPRGASWGEAAAATQFYVVLAPLMAVGAAQLVRGWMTQRRDDSTLPPLTIAARETAALAAGSILYLIAIADLGRVWAHFLETVIGTTGVGVLNGIATAAATGIVGVLIWVFLKRLFEAYLPKRKGTGPLVEDDDEEHEPTVQSRLSSVLPVLRGIALALVIALTLLVVLNRLGIDTGPLLAGFGIAGLALSFGSQALVRDVVSGIFFLADDAFRVGEYIDTGKLKGTVERITLRSVQLRHQSGLVHTIPYGQLQAVTNASRDWATIKFNIRLDRDADIEKARKTIKKVGQDLLTHEEFGEDFILPVKMQGITDIQDNALVVRMKFTAKPFRTSQIQREALKRIYLKLIEAGIPLATTEVRVRGGSIDAAAAAYAATTPVTVLPGPA